jgi:putative endonuclease
MFMSYLYILKSLKDGNLYTGTCRDEVKGRLQRHNKGLVKSTKSRRPLVLVYEEKFLTLSEARKREWELKCTPWGGKLKKKLAFRAAGSSNGRTWAFGAQYLGSNPSPAALNARRHKHT